MSKISLDRITSAFGFKDAFNAVLEKIEDEFSDKVLYRDNPPGTANAMRTDLDLGGNDVNNVGAINAEEFVVNGVDVNQAIEDVEAQIAAIPAETQGYRDEAIAARDAAEASEVAAGLSEAAASVSETNAAGSASTATTQAGLAAGYADEAENWANANEDVQVETGKYSAKHFSAKAEGFADDAAATKLLIDAQAAQVALDASESADNAAAAAAAVSTVTDAADAAAISAANAYGSEVAAQESLALCNAQVLVATDKATIASDAEAVATLKAQEALVSEGIATAKAQEAMLSASAASDSEDAAAASELAAAGSEALAASSASTAVAAKDVAVSSAQAASSDAGTASSARTDAINAKDAAEAAQAECEAIEEGLQTASTHSHSNKPFLDELNEKTIAGYNVIRSQNLPNVGDYQQGTFCIVDAYEPKKVYLNIGLWWIEIPQSDSLYGKVTRFDDVKLLYRVEDGGQRSAVGPDPNWSYSDRMYAEDGSYVGLNEPTDLNGDGQLWWSGPGYTNHITSNDITTWSKTGATITTDGDWYKVTESVLAEDHHVTSGITAVIGVSYTGSITIKPNGRNFAYVGLNGGGLAYFVSVDLITGALASVSGSPVFRSIRNNDGSITVYVSGVATSATSIVLDVRVAKDTNWASNRNYLGDGVSGISIQNPQLTTVFTAPYVPPLTTVNELTDYVPAIHGYKGVWCGPSYTNMAVGDTQSYFTLASNVVPSAPLDRCAIAPDGTKTAWSYEPNCGYTQRNYNITADTTRWTWSIYVKATQAGTKIPISGGLHPTKLISVNSLFDFDTDQFVGDALLDGINYDVEHLEYGWKRLNISFTNDGISNVFVTKITLNHSVNPVGPETLFWGNQLTNTPAAMPYVRNYKDVPYTTVASAAGTSGDNGIYFNMAEEPDGVELVYNGTFDDGVEGYSVVHPTVTAVDGKAVFTDTPAATNGLEQVFSTITGARYRASCTISTTVGGIGLGISSVQDAIYAFEESKIITFDFTAISSSTTLIVRANGAPLMTGWVDNISVQRLSSPLMQCFERSETDGVELVTNGTFDSDVSGWTALNSATITAESGRLKVSPLAGNAYGAAQSDITLEVGKTYVLNIDIESASNTSVQIYGVYYITTGANNGRKRIIFTPTSGSATIAVVVNNSTGVAAYFDNISVQKLKPATCTVAAEVTMGVGSGDIPINSTISNITTNNITTNIVYVQKGSDGTPTLAKSYDNTAVPYIVGSWDRNERHIKLVQTNADGTQFRVGNKRIGIDEAIQWGAWVNFDGSFNPLTALRLAYGNTVPIWFRRVMVSNKGGMSDTEIETRMVA
jgi:hypothetical protein